MPAVSRTANGEHYNHMGISAAHKSLPFGTRVVVRNQHTGRSITVRINDRGPFVAGRIIDLSTGAKNALGMDGLASVCLEVVSYGSEKKGFRNTEVISLSWRRTRRQRIMRCAWLIIIPVARPGSAMPIRAAAVPCTRMPAGSIMATGATRPTKTEEKLNAAVPGNPARRIFHD